MNERARRQWIDKNGARLADERVATLLDRYGTVAAEVIAAIVADPDDAPLQSAPAYSTAELAHLARTESVQHADDMVLRRTSLAFTGGVTLDSALEVAEAIAPVLGWDAAACRTEAARALAAVHAADPSWAAAHDDRDAVAR